MKTPQQLLALITLTLGLAPSFVLAQSPTGNPSAQPRAAGAAAPAAAARQPAVERPAAAAKRTARRQKDKATPQDGELPVATFPGFRMLADGSSRVFLQVNGKVEVTESKADRRLVYRMKGVQAIQTNRFPLVTSFFATPVAKVQLIGQGRDLDMVIDLRDRAEPKYTVVEGESGIVVQVDFPPAAVEKGTSEDAEPARAPTGRSGKRTLTPKPAEADDSSSGF